MVAPSDITNMFTNLFNNEVIGTIFKYTGYTVIAAAIIAILVALYFLVQYKYKIWYPELVWDSDKKTAKVWKYKKDLARVIKKDGMKKWRLLKLRQDLEPVSKELIMPGNRINLFKINSDGTWVAMPTVIKDGDFSFEYLTNEERMWSVLELKETSASNQTEDAQKRMLNYLIIGIVIVVIMVVVSVWLTLKYTGNITAALKDVAPSLQNIASGFKGLAPN
jgi:multidrug efflux pump subunit AcrB